MGKELFTLFVDNLPLRVDHHWLRKKFTEFGIVRDAFIPVKRSIKTGRRFGFIRYDCPVSAEVAIDKANGLRCLENTIYVKRATFDKQGMVDKSFFPKVGFDASIDPPVHHFGVVAPSKSFAEAVKGATTGNGNSLIKSIVVADNSDSWLHRSAIAKLKSYLSTTAVQNSFSDIGFGNVHVKTMGGFYIVITFQSIDLLESLLVENKQFQSKWFAFFHKWDGQSVPPSRIIWLTCFGVPLNVWCTDTFLSIGGLWGDVVNVDDKTRNFLAFDRGRVMVITEVLDKIDEVVNLNINGFVVKIRVTEDASSYVTSAEDHSSWNEIGYQRYGYSMTLGKVDVLAQEVFKPSLVDGYRKATGTDQNALEIGLDTDPLFSVMKEGVSAVGETTNNIVEVNIDVASEVAHNIDVAPEVAHVLAVENDGGDNEAYFNSFHGLDTLVGLESLVVESFAHSFQGPDRGVCISSGGSDPIQNSTFSGKAFWDQDFQSDFSDECLSIDLISADPLINYVELKRKKRKKSTKQGHRKKSFSLWRHNPLKATLFSRTNCLDKKDNKSRRFKQGQQKIRSNDKSPSILGPFSFGGNQQSDSWPSHSSLVAVNSNEKRMEDDYLATLITGKNLGISIRPGDEIVLKEMIEDEFKAFSQKIKQWEEIY